MELDQTEPTTPNSDDFYLNLLIELYSLLVKRSDGEFYAVILERLMSKYNQRSISLEMLIDALKEKEGKIGVVVGVVTDDDFIVHDVPAMKVTALWFTETARAGGECLTFDQFVSRDPTGKNMVWEVIKLIIIY
ncbi:unnamed protein product [Lathyrus oleraceus]|uniref:Large ribosomal subunit protein uL15/eL18 domain-containing protein n=1 Tax=Pisum sativum TaxID=3888 RepID=A0A9D4VNZ7_PEA|nr:60S ribosomal protein L18-3-like [Pisum sativum]KAI5387479.1 hypothetical protein KIW84_073558 [Pisum sativum]